MVTPGDYDFLVRRATELGLEIAVPEERAPLERMYNLPSREVAR